MLANIIGGIVFLGVVGFIAFKILKKKNPKLADKIEDEVEEIKDKVEDKFDKLR